MRWVQLFVCLVLGGSASSLQCPDGHSCKGSSICCKLSGEEGYSCCDQPQFTGASLRMFPPQDNSLLQVVEPSGVVCLDGRVCPVEYSCLRTEDDDLACCPWKEGISCAGGHYCCPLGSRCSPDGKSCSKSEVTTFPTRVGAVQCPDGESECPNESTCCMMPDGVWGCCPMPKALCCEDKIHCCPHNTTCDLPHARCFAASGEQQPLQKKFPASRRAVLLDSPRNSLCPGNQSSCPDTDTCCILPTGQYGCCHLPNAVCCRDRIHCCPQGTQCDLEHSRCTMTPQRSWPISHLTADLRQTVGVVQCDGEHTCPDGNTCCPRSPGEWGCCPLEEAVCCSDNIHCCPKDYTCNLAAGTCDEGGRSIPWLAKAPRSPPASSAGMAVPCDAHMECPEGHTCCRLPSGGWGCCPLPEAICCKDGSHCCPANYQCDLSKGTCTKDGGSIPWLEKQPALAGLASLREVNDIRCDDHMSCPDGYTCCRLPSGKWGCCPFPEAICCADHVHCCPKGYTCDPARSTCQSPQHTLPWAAKHPAGVPQNRGVRCNDTASCMEGQTCCRDVSGGWSCCQLPNAVCCEDHQHCCPSGYTCNVAAQTCEKQFWPRLLPAGGLLSSLRAPTAGRDVSCGDQHYCHDRQTCCKSSSGGWACCPYDKGSCCSDRRHCCPPGFRCSSRGTECIKQKPLRWDTGAFAPRSTQAHALL